ncbi:MAG TPA: CotH kinase family protein, partial [Verrucomicrobiota bacterium]|nr:CotH kinase family protein [Verrucomicrobiota bacterium]
IGAARADDGRLIARMSDWTMTLQVVGDADDDWRFQGSIDLSTWTDLPALGTLLSGRANAPVRSVGIPEGAMSCYRAVRTAGLFDPTLLRTIHLTFTQANWQTLLANGRSAGTNADCLELTVDNGAMATNIGARYRGNTSYTGMGGGGAPAKKSINIEIDYRIPDTDLMGYDTLNLNNAYMDETIMREALYFNIMRQYTICPAGCLVQLHINNANWGVYSMIQQQDGRLMKEYCPSSDGDRWRAPNMAGGPGGPGGDQTGASAFGYLGNTNVATYQRYYELKSDYNTNAWPRLVQAIDVLNRTASAQLRNRLEDCFGVDRWLWFLAIENVFADDDSYWNKGADYMFYYEPESGRIHPVEHDGNEAFVAQDSSLSPLQGATSASRPLLYRMLSIPELKQRYLAHMRVVLDENFNPANMEALVNQYSALSLAAIAADPKKGYTSMSTYTSDLAALKSFVTNRYRYLTNHAELRPLAPIIAAVCDPDPLPFADQVPFVTAQIHANAANGINSVWLYHRGKSYGRFTAVQMFDDGAHGDGAADDGRFGAATTNYPAGTRVRYYVEARSANASLAAAFSPARAEEDTHSYRVAIQTAAQSPVIINELMADNAACIADPQGNYDDWIELSNLTDEDLDLAGCHLSDEPNNPRKWAFPAGSILPANGFLLVWADEDGSDTPGLHASFKLSASGEQLYLTDADERLNAILDSVEFGPQSTDRSWGRPSTNAELWLDMSPTPGQPNE